MKYKENWEETKQRFTAWWKGENTDRPLLKIIARRKEQLEALEAIETPQSPMALHLDVDRRVKEIRNKCKTHIFLSEAFPYMDINIGPGSMATYIGSEPIFSWDTVWYTEFVRDWNTVGDLKYDANTYWWQHHQALVRKAQELSRGEFLVSIPDILENVDILSAIRGPQTFCYDLVDEPELMHKYIHQIDELYFKYYNPMYDILKLADGSCCYTAFCIWGPGKTAKVQCDFSAIMSPSQFREFVVPSLRKQCQVLDCSLYHLDGPDAIKHVDALMEIEELNALQWTPGAGKPDGGSELWYPIYEKVRKAGKSLWVAIGGSDFNEWMHKAERLVNAFGSQGLYLLFPVMEESEAQELLSKLQ